MEFIIDEEMALFNHAVEFSQRLCTCLVEENGVPRLLTSDEVIRRSFHLAELLIKEGVKRKAFHSAPPQGG